MSKLGAVVSLFFIILLLFGRITFPFGDEPDFQTRVERLADLDKNSLNILGYFDFYEEIEANNDCEIITSYLNPHSYISQECYDLNLHYFGKRVSFSLFSLSPLILFLIFNKKIYRWSRSYKNIPSSEWNKRISSLSLTLLLPSVIYILGFLTKEIIVSILSFFIFIFWGRKFIILFFLLAIYYLDNGNGLVVAFFSIILFFNGYLEKYRNKKVLILGFTIPIVIIFCFGQSILEILSSELNYVKLSEIYLTLHTGYYHNNYPLILRPIFTFLSLIFISAGGLKSILLFMIFFIFMIMASVRLVNKRDSIHSLVYFLSATETIILITLMIPTHAYSKYYIFLIPFFVYPLLQVYRTQTLILFFSSLTLITYINILFFYT